jgi:exopolysaccharide production protein ExoY
MGSIDMCGSKEYARRDVASPSISVLKLEIEQNSSIVSAIRAFPGRDSLPMKMQRNTPTFDFYQSTKRFLDICVALLGLLLLGLILPIFIACVFFEDRGPIFYRQRRVGQHGQSFVIYKLRTMVPNADQILRQNPELLSLWSRQGKMSYDPRVTRVGKILRRTSLDELPQMLNILCGQMSLVGPRAMQPGEDEVLGELAELRKRVKPGITGLWQVCGRSCTSYEQRGILDCMYVIERSLWMDFAIIQQTFAVVVRGIGAC